MRMSLQEPRCVGLRRFRGPRLIFCRRPGPRLVESLEILAHALHPGLHPPPAGLGPAERLTATELSG